MYDISVLYQMLNYQRENCEYIKVVLSVLRVLNSIRTVLIMYNISINRSESSHLEMIQVFPVFLHN